MIGLEIEMMGLVMIGLEIEMMWLVMIGPEMIGLENKKLEQRAGRCLNHKSAATLYMRRGASFPSTVLKCKVGC
jgi:hypothetical protein